MLHTLSFCIFDDLTGKHRIQTVELGEITEKNLTNKINELIRPYKVGIMRDHSDFFDKDFFESAYHLQSIIRQLLENQFWRRNIYNGYYIIGMALDYARFIITSIKRKPELIKWRVDDVNDPIKENVSDYYCNETNTIISQMSYKHNKPKTTCENELLKSRRKYFLFGS
jgi:hypothetical protein